MRAQSDMSQLSVMNNCHAVNEIKQHITSFNFCSHGRPQNKNFSRQTKSKIFWHHPSLAKKNIQHIYIEEIEMCRRLQIALFLSSFKPARILIGRIVKCKPTQKQRIRDERKPTSSEIFITKS